jgi:hypothetical protein
VYLQGYKTLYTQVCICVKWECEILGAHEKFKGPEKKFSGIKNLWSTDTLFEREYRSRYQYAYGTPLVCVIIEFIHSFIEKKQAQSKDIWKFTFYPYKSSKSTKMWDIGRDEWNLFNVACIFEVASRWTWTRTRGRSF